MATRWLRQVRRHIFDGPTSGGTVEQSTGADTRYIPITDKALISCIADPAGTGAMGIHYLYPDTLIDGVIDPNQPEAIVYAPSPSGSLHLVALEYIVDKAGGTPRTRRRPS